MRGCGRIARPAFPAPSVFRGGRFMHHSGASRREIVEVCAITTPVIARSESDEAIHLRSGDAERWIASLALAMMGWTAPTASVCQTGDVDSSRQGSRP